MEITKQNLQDLGFKVLVSGPKTYYRKNGFHLVEDDGVFKRDYAIFKDLEEIKAEYEVYRQREMDRLSHEINTLQSKLDFLKYDLRV